MTFKKAVLDTAASFFKSGIRLFGERKRTRLLLALTEGLDPVVSVKTEKGVIKFYCPGWIALWRAETLLTKEPETIEWIDGFDKDSVFWDIGANVGIYSLYAALRKDISVWAFEPSGFNYYILNKNIELNEVHDRVTSLCLALNDKTCLDRFYMQDTEAGGALNSFGEARDWQGKAYAPKFNQGMLGLAIDDFIEKFNPAFPNHIKIDVDGNEEKILQGALKTIRDERLRSVLIELESDREEERNRVITLFERSGMKFVSKRHAPILDGGKFSGVYNYIFKRA